MLIGIRHGERADRDPKEIKKMKIAYDPHLTPLGELQAEASGIRINSMINDYHKQLKSQKLIPEDQPNDIEAVILSSPFLRTLMTASKIASKIERVHQNKIFQQAEFCEYIATWDFSKDPLPDLYIKRQQKYLNNADQNDEKNKYPILDKYIDQSKIQITDQLFENKKSYVPVYPEKNIKDRVYKAIDGTVEYYLQNFDFTKYVFIIVSHQSIVEEGLRYFGYDIPLWSLEYCGLYQVAFPNPEKGIKEFYLLEKGDNSHINNVQLSK